MVVKEVMKQPVVTCGWDTNLAAAVGLMWKNACGVLPVVTNSGKIAGILTDRDICIALGTRDARASELRVRDVIQDNTLYCKSSDDIHTALQRMRQGQVRRLPVVSEDGSLEGIISMDDIVLIANGGGNGVSYGDVMTTLQAIYGGSRRCPRAA